MDYEFMYMDYGFMHLRKKKAQIVGPHKLPHLVYQINPGNSSDRYK